MSPDERFDALYRTHYAAVLRFARRRTDPATAEDVAAETFAIAWRRLERVPPEKPLPWLYTTAANELNNRRRKAASDEHKAAALGHETGRDPADALAERDAVLHALATLSARDREALRLVAWEDLSLADAAKVAGTTRVAFAVRVSRARKRLAAALEEDAPAAAAADGTNSRLAAPAPVSEGTTSRLAAPGDTAGGSTSWRAAPPASAPRRPAAHTIPGADHAR